MQINSRDGEDRDLCVGIKDLSTPDTAGRTHRGDALDQPKMQNIFTVKTNKSKRTKFEIYATKSSFLHFFHGCFLKGLRPQTASAAR